MKRWLWIGLVLLAVTAAVVAPSPRRGERDAVPESYRYTIEAYRDQEHAVARPYRRAARIPLALREPRALAAWAEGLVAVGDRALVILNDRGDEVARAALDAEPTAVAVDGGRIYVALGSRVAVYGMTGERLAAWESLGELAALTGLAILDGHIYAADGGQGTVWRLDAEGRLRGRIGRPGADGFLLPSGFFNLAAGEALLWVVNPGYRRVEAYTPSGERVRMWGRSAMALDGFSGCCNPQHVVLLPDGRFVTSEKGLPRVKVYSADGVFEALVAGSDDFGEGAGLALAVDAAGRIMVLDRVERCVHVFEREP